MEVEDGRNNYMKDSKIIAEEIGRYFFDHLQEELQKDPSIIDAKGFDNKTPREIHKSVLKDLLEIFPNLINLPRPNYNLFERWVKWNNFPIAYKDFTFDAYNIIFLYRIIAIRNFSKESSQYFKKVTLEVFDKFDYKRPGFSVSGFLDFENNMRELLRKILLEIPNIDQEEAWNLLFEQSKEYQAVVNEFFESILKKALDDSERLLKNILPEKIADELKSSNKVIPKHIPETSVVFTDFKGFTQLTEKMAPESLIQELDNCFSVFDQIIDSHKIEKIKTIGDSYMCASGVPEPSHTHAIDACLATLEMRDAMRELYIQRSKNGELYWKVRIGIHTGELTAGVIGQKKFSYDIWGDTVNTASRMESSGIEGEINVSKSVYDKVHFFFDMESRGFIEAKNKGKIEMYLLKGLKKKYQNHLDNSKPNEEFTSIYDRISKGARIKSNQHL